MDDSAVPRRAVDARDSGAASPCSGAQPLRLLVEWPTRVGWPPARRPGTGKAFPPHTLSVGADPVASSRRATSVGSRRNARKGVGRLSPPQPEGRVGLRYVLNPADDKGCPGHEVPTTEGPGGWSGATEEMLRAPLCCDTTTQGIRYQLASSRGNSSSNSVYLSCCSLKSS